MPFPKENQPMRHSFLAASLGGMPADRTFSWASCRTVMMMIVIAMMMVMTMGKKTCRWGRVLPPHVPQQRQDHEVNPSRPLGIKGRRSGTASRQLPLGRGKLPGPFLGRLAAGATALRPRGGRPVPRNGVRAFQGSCDRVLNFGFRGVLLGTLGLGRHFVLTT